MKKMLAVVLVAAMMLPTTVQAENRPDMPEGTIFTVGYVEGLDRGFTAGQTRYEDDVTVSTTVVVEEDDEFRVVDETYWLIDQGKMNPTVAAMNTYKNSNLRKIALKQGLKAEWRIRKKTKKKVVARLTLSGPKTSWEITQTTRKDPTWTYVTGWKFSGEEVTLKELKQKIRGRWK